MCNDELPVSGHPTKCSKCGADKIKGTHVCSKCKYGDHGMTQEEIDDFYRQCRAHRRRIQLPRYNPRR